MNKEFIPYEQALELKELGFYEGCIAHYEKVDGKIKLEVYSYDLDDAICAAPLYQQVFRWFRERYGLYSEIFVDDNKTFGFLISSFIEEGRLDKPITRQFDSYDEAELGCIKQLIEIVDRKAEAYS